jgi:hypothetical protein
MERVAWKEWAMIPDLEEGRNIKAGRSLLEENPIDTELQNLEENE